MLKINRLFGGDFLLKDYIQFKDVKKIYKMGEVEIEALPVSECSTKID